MRRTRASTAAASVAVAAPATRPAAAEPITIDDDDGEQVIDVQLTPQLDESQKENLSLAASNSLFDKYRFKATPNTSDSVAANRADTALTKRKPETLPFITRKRTKSSTPTKSAKPTKPKPVTASTPNTSTTLATPTTPPSTFPTTMRHRSLAPLLPNPSLGHPPPTLLIVGSAPSCTSLAAQHYYAYKYNHFWPIVSRLFHFDHTTLSYEERCVALTSHGIAVWDVCQEFTRKGSLDSNLRAVIPNDFNSLLNQYPTIRMVASNGGTSGALFRKHIGSGECVRRRIVHVVLPSSSPAHAMKNAVEEKTKKWREILQVGEDGELMLAKQSSDISNGKAQTAVGEAEQGDLVEIED